MLLTLLQSRGAVPPPVVVVVPKQVTGSFDPARWQGKKRKRYILPDGTVVMASPQEAGQILRLLQAEYDQEIPAPVEVRPTLKKVPRDEFEAWQEANFPRSIPVIPDDIEVHVPTFQADFESAYRYYIEARKRKDEEDLWLMTLQ